MSERIDRLIAMVIGAHLVADVGCDHGQVSLGLAARPDIDGVLGVDVSAPSLQKLRDALERSDAPWRSKLMTQVADGLKDLTCERIDGIVIAGMGGDLIIRILSAAPERLSQAGQLVLSPHTAQDEVRRFVRANGFYIMDSELIREDGHYYELMDARPGAADLTAASAYEALAMRLEARFGRWAELYGYRLIEKRDPVLRARVEDALAERRLLMARLREQPQSARIAERMGQLKGECRVHEAILKQMKETEEG